jgi:Leucine-rich repeat (LRR) protein
MGLMELPTELFRMKNVKTLCLQGNNLCSLESDIALMTTLEELSVRLSK